MSFINWGHETPEQKEIRRKLEERAIQEHIAFKRLMEARGNSSSAATAAGAAGSGRLTNLINGYIAEYETTFDENIVRLRTANLDIYGNLYSIFSGNNGNIGLDDFFLINKLNDTSSAYSHLLSFTLAEINPPFVSPVRIFEGNDGYLYMISESSIRKTTKENVVVWEYANNSDDVRYAAITQNQEGDLYVVLRKYLPSFPYNYLQKIDSSNGNIIASKKIEIVDSNINGTVYISSPITVDSLGRPIITLSWNTDSDEYAGVVIKLESDLSEYVWYRLMDPAAAGSDCDITGLCVDSNDNVYVNGYGKSVYKLDSDGNPIWWKKLSNNGDIYSVVCSQNDRLYLSGVDGDSLYIICLNTDGDLVWSTEMTDTVGPGLSNVWSTNVNTDLSIKLTDGGEALIVLFEGNSKKAVAVLPTSEITGEFGDYLFQSYVPGFTDVNLDTLTTNIIMTSEDPIISMEPDYVKTDVSIQPIITNL